MKLKVLGSSSKGNCYILESDDGDRIIIEAGVHPTTIWNAINFEVDSVLGALCSHSHGDHTKYSVDLTFKAINVYCNSHVREVHGLNMNHRFVVVEHLKPFDLGPYTVLPFDVVHDVPTLAFMIYHPEMGNLVFATDTYYFKYKFENVNNWLVEANYNKEVLDQGTDHESLRNRIVQSHMSCENLIRMLKMNDMSQTRNIILAHLSDRNSDESAMVKEIRSEFGVPVHIADPGKEFDLSEI